MHFEDDSIESLVEFINSPIFKTMELSQTIADALIKRCEEHGLTKEIETIESVKMKRLQ